MNLVPSVSISHFLRPVCFIFKGQIFCLARVKMISLFRRDGSSFTLTTQQISYIGLFSPFYRQKVTMKKKKDSLLFCFLCLPLAFGAW